VFWKVCWNGDTLVLITLLIYLALACFVLKFTAIMYELLGGNRADLILIATMFNFIIITVQYAVFSF